VRQRRADVGDHGRRAGEQRRPPDVRHGGHQNVAGPEFPALVDGGQHPDGSLDDARRARESGDRVAQGSDVARLVEDVAAPVGAGRPPERVEMPPDQRRIGRQGRIPPVRVPPHRHPVQRCPVAAQDVQDLLDRQEEQVVARAGEHARAQHEAAQHPERPDHLRPRGLPTPRRPRGAGHPLPQRADLARVPGPEPFECRRAYLFLARQQGAYVGARLADFGQFPADPVRVLRRARQ
jgi:hypothetical protein